MIRDYLEAHKAEYDRWLVGKEQGRIDIKILPFLQDIKDGFFVEAGALDGLFMSNTKILEDLGWKGLLIEPAPKAFKKCCANRKNCIIEHCALVSRDFKEEWIIGDFFFDGEDGIGAWSGVHRNAYGIKAAMKVPARTFDTLFKRHNITKIDFLSLDVEGYEPEALDGIDFNTTDITYILIEVNTNDYTLGEMDRYLANFGYKNLGCLSGFTKDLDGWDGSHNDYLYGKV